MSEPQELTEEEKQLVFQAARSWGNSPGSFYLSQEAGIVQWNLNKLEWKDSDRNLKDPITTGYTRKYG